MNIFVVGYVIMMVVVWLVWYIMILSLPCLNLWLFCPASFLYHHRIKKPCIQRKKHYYYHIIIILMKITTYEATRSQGGNENHDFTFFFFSQSSSYIFLRVVLGC